MTAAVSSSKPPRVRFGGWLRNSLSSLGSSLSGASSSARSSMASSISSSTSDSDSRRSSMSLSPPKQRGRREIGALLREVMGADSNWASEAQVAEHYAQLGWGVTAIAGDGNCLFRAISDQLFGDQELHADVRRRLVDFIERERELFAPFLELEGESVAAYCVRMRRDGQWGGNPELYAAAKCFRVHLVVHQGPQRRLRIENDDDVGPGKDESERGEQQQQEDAPAFKTLHLLYTGNHYRSLHPCEVESVGSDAENRASDAEPVEQTEIDEAEDQTVGEVTQEVGTAQSDGVNDGHPVSDPEDNVAGTNKPELPPRAEAPAVPERQSLSVSPLVSETAEVPHVGVWIPQRVVFRSGRRRLNSAVLSLVHEPSMNHLALSVTTEIDFEDSDVKKHTLKKHTITKVPKKSSTATTRTTVKPRASGPQPESQVEPQVESVGRQERASMSVCIDDLQVEHVPEKKQPRVAEAVDDAVPVVFAKRTRFHKGKPKRAVAASGRAQQRASMH